MQTSGRVEAITYPHQRRLLVFAPLYPPSVGGLQSHADEFNKYLAERGYRITVFTPRLTKRHPLTEIRHGSVRVWRFPAWEIIGNYPLPALTHPLFWRLWRQLNAQSFDLVISRTRFFSTTVMAMIFARRRLPWMHIEHGADHVHLGSRAARRLAQWYDQTIGAWMLGRATHLIANSEASAQFVRSLAGHREVKVIYRGIDHEAIDRIAASEQINQRPSQVVIMYLGRLIAGKGVDGLLEALAALPRERVRCLIVGNGPQRLALIRHAHRRGLMSLCTFIPEQPWAKAVAWLKGADIIVNPSYAEGMPTAVIEAMLCGKAVVATSVGGTRELIIPGVTGILVPPGDVSALISALTRLIDDASLRQRLGLSAQARTMNQFRWPTSLDAYEAAMASVVRRH